MNPTTIALITIVSALPAAFTLPVHGVPREGDDQVVQLTPLPTGAMKKIGYYMPMRLELSEQKPDGLKKSPEHLQHASYGTLHFGAAVDKDTGAPPVIVIVDEPADGEPHLYADVNHNGDLTDDPVPEWKANPENQLCAGNVSVELGSKEHPFPASLSMYRFDRTSDRGKGPQNLLLYYRDYAYEGSITLGGKSYKAMLVDERCAGDFRGSAPAEGEEAGGSGVQLLIDVNNTDHFDSRGESFDVRQPFNIGGTTYEITGMAADGSQFKIIKSQKTVQEIPTPPDHRVGKKITAFEAKTMDGKPLRFPEDFKGKIVLLDFWATWCGPCMKEMPNVVAAYEKFKSQGMEILGVTLDNEDAVEKINSTMEKAKMTWPQVYDGKGWKAAVAELYNIHAIPAAFLVDGDTGEILAGSGSLRGEKLAETIGKSIEKKSKSG